MPDKIDLGWVTIPTEEFERLHAENEQARVALADADAAGMALVQESERLRALLDHAEDANGQLTVERESLRTENERLRAVIEAAATEPSTHPDVAAALLRALDREIKSPLDLDEQ